MSNRWPVPRVILLLLGALLLLVAPALAADALKAPNVRAAEALSPSGFTFRWDSVSGARSYRVEVARNRHFSSYVPGQRDRSAGLSRQHTVRSLRSGEEYWYRVRAVGADGQGPWSAARSVRIPLAAPAPMDARPLGPTSFEARWRAGSGATRHEVQVARDARFSWPARGLRESRKFSATSRVFERAEPGSTLWWRVRAVGDTGPGAWSAPQEVSLPPPAPRLLAPTLSTPRTIVARWEPAPGARGYRVDVARDPEFRFFLPAWRGRGTGSLTSVVVSGLEPGTTYHLRVQGTGPGGAGPASAPMAFTTPAATQ